MIGLGRRVAATPDEARRTRHDKTTRTGSVVMGLTSQVFGSLLILIPVALTETGRLSPVPEARRPRVVDLGGDAGHWRQAA